MPNPLQHPLQPAFVDANIFIRFFTNDDPKKAKQIKKLFEQTKEGKYRLITNILVLAEIEFVLRRQYKISRKKITELLNSIFTIPNLNIADAQVAQNALQTYESSKADIIDCINYAFMKSENVSQIISYDTHFDKFTGIERTAP